MVLCFNCTLILILKYLYLVLGCFLMSSTAHGKNWNEPQNFSKVETVSNLEAEYENPALVGSRADEISSKNPYEHLNLGEIWETKFGNHQKSNETIGNIFFYSDKVITPCYMLFINLLCSGKCKTKKKFQRCKRCCERKGIRCTKRNKDNKDDCAPAAGICLEQCDPNGRK